jgi:hypothetical protein
VRDDIDSNTKRKSGVVRFLKDITSHAWTFLRAPTSPRQETQISLHNDSRTLILRPSSRDYSVSLSVRRQSLEALQREFNRSFAVNNVRNSFACSRHSRQTYRTFSNSLPLSVRRFFELRPKVLQDISSANRAFACQLIRISSAR